MSGSDLDTKMSAMQTPTLAQVLHEDRQREQTSQGAAFMLKSVRGVHSRLKASTWQAQTLSHLSAYDDAAVAQWCPPPQSQPSNAQ